MSHTGETVALFVSISWTATALLGEVASKRFGANQLNVIRMLLSILLLAVTLTVFTGSPLPQHANAQAWMWLSFSGVVGFAFGDYCLFNCYIVIGSRFGQMFMTLAPPAAAVSAYLLLGESMGALAIAGMLTTMLGICISVFNRSGQNHHVSLKLPLRGVLLGIGAGIGQGTGLVLSKIGLECYTSAIPADATATTMMLPFASTMMRSITGLLFFSLMLLKSRQVADMKRCFSDRKGMQAALAATITGPFIGVSMSLYAVAHTSSGIAQTLMALTPVLIILPSWLMFRQRITTKEIIGAIICVAGASLFFI